jgi:hypothetical protein
MWRMNCDNQVEWIGLGSVIERFTKNQLENENVGTGSAMIVNWQNLM